ncbi:hypothetical protein [uncultured Algimonas sp.]|uniref:hypothetical protein n=1 Tax=uncultured Algimonas sp. TaxID=1547920 RepID=UPI002620DDC2|nr:hypothetical protein [uncultured Algimonas sp.]
MDFYRLISTVLLGGFALGAEPVGKSRILLSPQNIASTTFIPIEIYLNKSGPLIFMLDSGSYMSSISHSFAEKAGYLDSSDKKTSVRIEQIDGPAEFELSREVALEAEFSSDVVSTRLLVESGVDDHFPPNVVGIIGRDILAGTKLTNHPDKGISLEEVLPGGQCNIANRSDRCEELRNSHPIIEGEWLGHQTDFVLDTGALDVDDSIILKSPISERTWYSDASRLPIRSDERLSNLSSRQLRSSAETIGDLSNCLLQSYIKDPEDSSSSYDKSTILLGFEFLKHVAFTMDFSTQSMKFEKADCPEFARDTSGIIHFNVEPDAPKKIFIQHVDIGSPSWMSGVRSGDTIVGVEDAEGRYWTHFDSEFFEAAENHFAAPAGNKILLYILRNGEIIEREFISDDYMKI